ncbi:MAG: extracellular matrix/biofilm biosynthesis regulator RemA family protein [Eubacteriales bacterium]
MAAKFINVGYGNLVAAARIVTVASPDAAPIKRMVQDARDAGCLIDVSCGKKTRSVIVTDSRHVIISSLEPEALEMLLNQED